MCSIQICSQTAFTNLSGQSQNSALMSQYPPPLEKSEPKDGSRDWVTDTNSWQRSSYENKRQSSPITDQRNSNFERGQQNNNNSGRMQPRWMQSDTAVARNDRNVRDYQWEQTNMSVPRDGTARQESDSRWKSSNVSTPRDECDRGESRWDEPNPMISRDNRGRNETKWDNGDQAYTQSLRSPSRPSMDTHNRYNNRSDLPSKNYEDRKAVQGNRGVGYGHQISTHYPQPFNTNVVGVPGQLSSVFGSRVAKSVQEPSGNKGKGQGPSRWDNSNRTSGRPQENPQQRHSFIEKNRPERVSRPSPRHEEQCISRSFKPGDRRQDRAFNKRPQDLRSAQEPQMKRFAGQPFARPNLPKTTRRTSPYRPPRKEPPKNKQSVPPLKTNLTTLLHKDHTWRHQAASTLAKQTLQSMDIKDMGSKDLITKKLKASVKSRIDVLLGEKVAIPLEEIIKMYRERFDFQTDQAFFVAVLDSMKDDEENQPNTYKPGNDIFYLMI